MTAVLIVVLAWCCVSVVAAAAWASLKREDRRERRAREAVSQREAEVAELEAELHIGDPESAPDDLGISLTREQYRRDCLAYHLRQPVTLHEATRGAR